MSNICSNCGANNQPQAKFCYNCGQALQSSQAPSAPPNCPQCSVPLRSTARFCPSCGYNLVLHQGSERIPDEAASEDVRLKEVGIYERPKMATQLLSDQDTAPIIAVQWMGGNVQRHQFLKSALNIGRAADNDLVINHPTVSGHHLRLEKVAERISITDLGSTNGTQVNGHRIPPNSATTIQIGDVIRIGDLTGNWVGLKLEGPTGESIRMQALDSLDLSPLTNITIGRNPNSNLHLDHPTVSFDHAIITKQNGTIQIRDLQSTNGTFLNDARIFQASLNSGDVVQIGPYKLVYNAQQQNISPALHLGHRLDAVNLTREVPKRRSGIKSMLQRRGTIRILNDISISVQPGDFVALVGGSGAGKSTLLKAMNGFEPANLGQMLIDGEPLYSRIDLYRNQMGYVPQDDIIHRELPVRLALRYSAKLRLPDARPEEIEARIMEALRAVDMVEHADKPVRVLSGGQRKRVSIAVELLAKPTLFFLDEPTSGLDPGLEKRMMYDLNRLADEGRTVVLVTHATANIEQCNYVSFLTWGKLAYFGPPSEAKQFFEVQDFADIYLRLSEEYDPARGKTPPPQLQPYYQQQARGNGSKVRSGDLWADHFRQSSIYRQHVANRQINIGVGGAAGSLPAAEPKRGRDNMFRQTWILGRRMFDLIRHDMRTLVILLLMMPFIATLFGLVSSERDIVDGLLVTSGNTYAEEVIDEGRDGSLYVMTQPAIEEEMTAQLEGEPVDTERSHTPYQDAKILLVMIGLAMTQGGTFGAAYEIVKEQAIFKRERAVNLKVSAYVLSKILVLALFALVQVALVVLILWLFIDLDYETLIFPEGYLEIFVTIFLAVIASICLGLFISAAVPNTDIVLYIILAQLFIQIILSGALFPLPSNPASYATPGYWAMNALGSQTNLRGQNELGTSCKVVEVPPIPGQTSETTTDVVCAAANAPKSEDDFLESLEYTEEHVLFTWGILGVHTIFWTILTVIVLARKKIE